MLGIRRPTTDRLSLVPLRSCRSTHSNGYCGPSTMEQQRTHTSWSYVTRYPEAANLWHRSCGRETKKTIQPSKYSKGNTNGSGDKRHLPTVGRALPLAKCPQHPDNSVSPSNRRPCRTVQSGFEGHAVKNSDRRGKRLTNNKSYQLARSDFQLRLMTHTMGPGGSSDQARSPSVA